MIYNRVYCCNQAIEQELSQWEHKAQALMVTGADLVSSGHFDGDAIRSESDALLHACAALKEPAAKRRALLEGALQ